MALEAAVPASATCRIASSSASATTLGGNCAGCVGGQGSRAPSICSARSRSRPQRQMPIATAASRPWSSSPRSAPSSPMAASSSATRWARSARQPLGQVPGAGALLRPEAPGRARPMPRSGFGRCWPGSRARRARAPGHGVARHPRGDARRDVRPPRRRGVLTGPSTGLVVQAYLRDSPAQLERVIEWASASPRRPPPAVRLVEGRVLGPRGRRGPAARLADPVFTDKAGSRPQLRTHRAAARRPPARPGRDRLPRLRSLARDCAEPDRGG